MRRNRLHDGLVVLCLIGAASIAPGCSEAPAPDYAHASRSAGPAHSPRPPLRIPDTADVRRAREFAAERGPQVAFAVIDSRGRPHGFREAQPHRSASSTKALLLAAYLDQAGDQPLDAAARERLRAMITYSDNDAADAVYATVGDEGMAAVAERAGMRDLGLAGYWSETWITARDMARFMWRLTRRVLRPPHRRFALDLLAGIIPEQRWGIPEAAGERWSVWFKGGWRPGPTGSLVNQAALLGDGRRRVSIAVLTDGQPSHEYGTETIRGVADRLLG